MVDHYVDIPWNLWPTSGQCYAIYGSMRYRHFLYAIYLHISKVASPLDLMVNTLVWRHIAPTVPDTLAAYPYKDEDPFILDQCPHVYHWQFYLLT